MYNQYNYLDDCNCQDDNLGAFPAIAKAVKAAGKMTYSAVARQKNLKNSAPECGQRPFFIGKKRKEWNECVKNIGSAFPGSDQNILPNETEQKSFIQKNKTPIMIGAGLVGLLIISKIVR